MEEIVLNSSGSGYLKLGITQESTEIKNGLNTYRILVKPVDAGWVANVVEALEENIWVVKDIPSIINLATALLTSHKSSFNLELFEQNPEFYLEVIESKQGDPYEGLRTPMGEIEKLINAPNPFVAEEVFVRDYAVFFLSDYDEMCKKDPEYPDKYMAAMKRWGATVAPHSVDVDVVHQTSISREVLFTIPSRVLGDEIFNPHQGSETIEEVLYETAFIGQTDPAGAERYLEKGLSSKLSPMSDKEMLSRNRKAIMMLDDVRERYGFARFLPKAEEETKKETNLPLDDKGFDDDEMGEF